MNQVFKALILSIAIPFLGCAHVNAESGPGMIVTYSSLKKGVRLSIKSAQTQSGSAFPNAGSFGPNKKWESGATMGAAPDGRQLPEWVDFEWIESAYPEDPKQTLDEYRALPRHRERVRVRDRVPQDAVEEILQSQRGTPPGKLPEKMLWGYLVWTDSGIKFRWKIERVAPRPGEVSVLRSGGDALP